MRKIPRSWLLLILGPLAAIALGFILNWLVIGANGGQMPCYHCHIPLMDFRHTYVGPQTHLNFLADWIPFESLMLSPGDVLVLLGSLALFPYAGLFIGLVINLWVSKSK